jgi:hypothetical protein
MNGNLREATNQRSDRNLREATRQAPPTIWPWVPVEREARNRIASRGWRRFVPTQVTRFGWVCVFLSERRDLNPGPPEPHSGALPGCATLRLSLPEQGTKAPVNNQPDKDLLTASPALRPTVRLTRFRPPQQGNRTPSRSHKKRVPAEGTPFSAHNESLSSVS